MSRRKGSYLGTVLLLVALIAGATQASASELRAQAACDPVTGPGWKDPAFGKSGNTWLVGAKGVRCSFAEQWSARLVRTPWRGEVATVLRGPAGWKCRPRVGGTVSSRGTTGECRKGTKLFFWGPKV